MDYDDVPDAAETRKSEEDDWKRKYQEQKQKTAELARVAAEKLNQDDGLKDKMRNLFIDELMRRQELSGTFEVTEGLLYIST